MNGPLQADSGVPYYRQIINRVMMGIADGRLPVGARLPTVRQLAVDLKVNPNTVARAYRDLELVGVLETSPGRGTFVAERRTKAPEQARSRELDRLCRDVIAQTSERGFALDELIESLEEHRRQTSGRAAGPAARRTKDNQRGRRPS